MLEVVAALIWDHDRFLICQRPANKARQLLWEYVGGKVEPGETKEAALERECKEELNTGVYTRHVGLDRDTNKELLLKHIRQNNEVGTPFKELQQVLPGLNRNQIQVLMRELKEDGKVVCKGKTSAARWFIIK